MDGQDGHPCLFACSTSSFVRLCSLLVLLSRSSASKRAGTAGAAARGRYLSARPPRSARPATAPNVVFCGFEAVCAGTRCYWDRGWALSVPPLGGGDGRGAVGGRLTGRVGGGGQAGSRAGRSRPGSLGAGRHLAAAGGPDHDGAHDGGAASIRRAARCGPRERGFGSGGCLVGCIARRDVPLGGSRAQCANTRRARRRPGRGARHGAGSSLRAPRPARHDAGTGTGAMELPGPMSAQPFWKGRFSNRWAKKA